MGRYVDELQQIVRAGHWSEVNAAYRENALKALETKLSNMSMLGRESWSGESGDAARAAYGAVMEEFARFRADLEKVDRVCHAGNTALRNATHSLAEITADYGFNPAEWVNETFFNADEDRARAALTELRRTLRTYSNLLPDFNVRVEGQWDPDIPIPDPVVPSPAPTPTRRVGTGRIGGGALPTGGGYTPPAGGGGGFSPPGSGGSGSGGSDSGGGDFSVDDRGIGHTSSGSSGLGSFALGGGSAAAAAALRARTSGLGGGGGLGSPVTGTGGILGGGTASGAGGSGGAGAAGAGAAGGRGGMMGGGGAGAGKTEKGKRAGMGGAIAPKLEDDPEYTPLPEGARAGRRAAKDAGL